MATKRKRIVYNAMAERRAVLYARYSSEQQRDSWSIDAQVADLRAHCQRMGWAVLDDVCIDEAISGKTEERPGLDRAMALIQAGKANVLVVHKLDRFFRNMAKTFEYVAELEEHGAGLVCTQQPIDTTNPVSGKIVLAVMAALAEIYLDNLSEETAKGKRARAAAGLPNGDLPYGYRNPDAGTGRSRAGVNNATTAAIVPEEAEAVRLAYTLYAEGQAGDAEIARALNARGLVMRSKRQPAGGRFNKDSVRAMLSNPYYTGWVVQPTAEVLTWSDRHAHAPRVRGRHEPIIPEELFARAQGARASRRGVDARGTGRRGPVQVTHAPYIGRGMARCGSCGRRLWGQTTESSGPHYRCHTASRGGLCGSGRKSIPADHVDAVIAAAVRGLRLPEDWRARILDELGEIEAPAAQVEARRADLEARAARARALLVDGVLSRSDYQAERARIDADLAALGVLPTRPGQVDAEEVAALLADLGRLWDGACDEERRELASRVIAEVRCDLDDPATLEVGVHPALAQLWPALPGGIIQRVTDGTRTHNPRNHNPMLHH